MDRSFGNQYIDRFAHENVGIMPLTHGEVMAARAKDIAEQTANGNTGIHEASEAQTVEPTNSRSDVGWKRMANCLGTVGVHFSEDDEGVVEAQAICAECPVKVDCLEYALKNRINHGVWGGASEKDRRRILRQRRKQNR